MEKAQSPKIAKIKSIHGELFDLSVQQVLYDQIRNGKWIANSHVQYILVEYSNFVLRRIGEEHCPNKVWDLYDAAAGDGVDC